MSDAKSAVVTYLKYTVSDALAARTDAVLFQHYHGAGQHRARDMGTGRISRHGLAEAAEERPQFPAAS